MMDDPGDRLEALRRDMQYLLPGFEIREKRVWWIWLIYYVSFMWLWNRNFMETMWLTLGRKVYMPYAVKFGYDVYGDYATLWHERKHIVDLIALEARVQRYVRWPWLSRRLAGLLWTGGYAFPQVLALGALGALWGGPWWLLALLALGPWPAPIRERIEMRGYQATVEAWSDINNRPPNEQDQEWIQDMIQRVFLGWGYYKMSWSTKYVQEHFILVTALLKQQHANGTMVDNVT